VPRERAGARSSYRLQGYGVHAPGQRQLWRSCYGATLPAPASAHAGEAVIQFFSYAKGDKTDELALSIRARVLFFMASTDRGRRRPTGSVTMDLQARRSGVLQDPRSTPLRECPVLPSNIQNSRSQIPDLVVGSTDVCFGPQQAYRLRPHTSWGPTSSSSNTVRPRANDENAEMST